jgi:hypothetical protein
MKGEPRLAHAARPSQGHQPDIVSEKEPPQLSSFSFSPDEGGELDRQSMLPGWHAEWHGVLASAGFQERLAIGRESKGRNQQRQGIRPGSPADASLQVADRARAETRPFRQRLVRQAGFDAEASENHTEWLRFVHRTSPGSCRVRPIVPVAPVLLFLFAPLAAGAVGKSWMSRARTSWNTPLGGRILISGHMPSNDLNQEQAS